MESKGTYPFAAKNSPRTGPNGRSTGVAAFRVKASTMTLEFTHSPSGSALTSAHVHKRARTSGNEIGFPCSVQRPCSVAWFQSKNHPRNRARFPAQDHACSIPSNPADKRLLTRSEGNRHEQEVHPGDRKKFTRDKANSPKEFTPNEIHPREFTQSRASARQAFRPEPKLKGRKPAGRPLYLRSLGGDWISYPARPCDEARSG
jgi:hypothetical protein